MSTQSDAIERLNACKYLYLVRYEEAPEEMDLRVVVHEGRVEDDPRPIGMGNEDLDRILGEARSISVRPGCCAFALTFRKYLAFVVRNESYAQPEADEDYDKMLRTYEQSTFLDFVRKSMSVSESYPGPFRHFAVICCNHVIDVACMTEPEIVYREIRPHDVED